MPKLFTKSVLMTALAGFVVFSLYGFIVHGILLQDMYASLPQGLWRPEGEEKMLWILIAYALMAWVLAALRPADVTTSMVGFQRGLLLGVFLGSVNFIFYAIQPWTLEVTLVAFAADVFMPAVAGLVMAPVAARFSD
ncbi:MAG: hypothetical protein IID51_11855 [Proteobacteria bacterium]|nr:hypothetical protein [Pseudomonadota bacterium]